MNSQVASFVRDALNRALTPVGLFQASHSKLCLSVPGTQKQIWITTELIGPRHGCGDTGPDAFWAHSNDVDLFAGSNGYTIDVVKLSVGHMIEPICEKLDKVFTEAEQVEMNVQFFPYPNYPAVPSLEGNSETGVIRTVSA